MSQPHVFSERQCGGMMRTLYGPELNEFSGYGLELTVIYTIGRDRNWDVIGGANTSQTRGVTAGAFLDQQRKKVAGAALIDLVAILKTLKPVPSNVLSPYGGRKQDKTNLNTQSFDTYRFEVLFTLAHEMFHFVEHWRAGNHLDDGEINSPATEAYTKTFHQIRRTLEEAHPRMSEEALHVAAHERHPSEREADRMARTRLGKFRRDIAEGRWDACLPIPELRKIFRR